MEACYGGTDVMERSCAVARGIDINSTVAVAAPGTRVVHCCADLCLYYFTACVIPRLLGGSGSGARTSKYKQY
jgi:hypothetical protein